MLYEDDLGRVRFQGSLAVAIIVIDGSEKPNRQLGFELQSSHVIENRNKCDDGDDGDKLSSLAALVSALQACNSTVPLV